MIQPSWSDCFFEHFVDFKEDRKTKKMGRDRDEGGYRVQRCGFLCRWHQLPVCVISGAICMSSLLSFINSLSCSLLISISPSLFTMLIFPSPVWWSEGWGLSCSCHTMSPLPLKGFEPKASYWWKLQWCHCRGVLSPITSQSPFLHTLCCRF